MNYTLPDLLYPYEALEPYIDAKTMYIHHTKHHQGYINKLNASLAEAGVKEHTSIEELLCSLKKLPYNIQLSVRNNGGGHANHTLFWRSMNPAGGGVPEKSCLLMMIEKHFGSFDKFQAQFSQQAQAIFGSGWAWLVVDKKGTPSLMVTANQDSPLLEGAYPLVGLDVWEHAYYLHYQNKRADYIEAWWNVVDWETIDQNYETVMSSL
ncbi:MAG: superoxide dismutase [Candidatus Babeliales bacterium]